MTFWDLINARPFWATGWLVLVLLVGSLLFILWLDFYPHRRK